MKQHEAVNELVAKLENLAHVLATDECYAQEPHPCLWMWQFENGEWFDDPFSTEEECEWNSWQHTKFGNGDASGPTPLIAAMRCFCCSKLGNEIAVPEELL